MKFQINFFMFIYLPVKKNTFFNNSIFILIAYFQISIIVSSHFTSSRTKMYGHFDLFYSDSRTINKNLLCNRSY